MSGEPARAIEATEPRTWPRRPAGRLATSVLFAIGTGGALGSLARYGIGRHWPTAPGDFPWSTLAVNVLGSLLLGVVATLVIERWPPTRFVRPFAAIGVCGGYTTWSTFMTETALLVRDDRAGVAAAYVAASLAAGLIATYTGIWLARLCPTEARRSP